MYVCSLLRKNDYYLLFVTLIYIFYILILFSIINYYFVFGCRVWLHDVVCVRGVRGQLAGGNCFPPLCGS